MHSRRIFLRDSAVAMVGVGAAIVGISLAFAPFEIKTIRVERNGRAAVVRMIEEDHA